MGHFDIHIDMDKGLTEFIGSGKVKHDDLAEAIKFYYQGTVTPLVLWDVSRADIMEIGISDTDNIARLGKELSHSRQGGRTAVLVSTDLSFGILRQHEAFAEIYGLPFKVKTFRHRQEALSWLYGK